jgi:hypothetical protein
LLGWSPEDEALACYQCALIAPETGIRTSPLFQKGVAIWSQRNVSGVGMSRRISTCMTAPTISRRRTWLARNDSSVSCVGTSRSLAAMALRVSLSRSTKWRRDDEPLEPQARRAGRTHAVRVGQEFEHVAIFGWQRDGERTPDLERQAPTRAVSTLRGSKRSEHGPVPDTAPQPRTRDKATALTTRGHPSSRRNLASCSHQTNA